MGFDFAETNISWLAWGGAIILLIAHHSELIWFRGYQNRSHFKPLQSSGIGNFVNLFSLSNQMVWSSIFFELVALTAWALSISMNAGNRPDSFVSKDNEGTWNQLSNETVRFMTGASVVAIILTRFFLFRIYTDGGHENRKLEYGAGALVNAFAWIVLAWVVTFDKPFDAQMMAWFGGGMVVLNHLVSSSVYYRKFEDSVAELLPRIIDGTSRILLGAGGTFILATAIATQTESSRT